MEGPGWVMVPCVSPQARCHLDGFPSWGPRSVLEWPFLRVDQAWQDLEVPSAAPQSGRLELGPWPVGDPWAALMPAPPDSGIPQPCAAPLPPPAWQRPLPARPGPHSSLWAPGAQNSSTALAPHLLPWPPGALECGPGKVRASLHRGAWPSQSPKTLGFPYESRCMIGPELAGTPQETEPEQGSQ